jgi:ABC-type Fe3+/spermidine/putrescine transport system ATPase subunit
MNAGRLEQLGTPRDIYERPATAFVADFVGASTVLSGGSCHRGWSSLRPASAHRSRSHVPPLRTPCACSGGPSMWRSASPTAPRGALTATVTSVTYLGDRLDLRWSRPRCDRPRPRGQRPGVAGRRSDRRPVPPDAFLELG